jgi:hypothetical protein
MGTSSGVIPSGAVLQVKARDLARIAACIKTKLRDYQVLGRILIFQRLPPHRNDLRTFSITYSKLQQLTDAA